MAPLETLPAGPPGPPAALLVVDTSTERMHMAVSHDGTLWLADEAGGAAASSRVVGLAEQMLAAAGLHWAALDAVGFARGPGAFTGLRVAAAVAQGWAFGAGRPVLAVDSLLVVAEAARQQVAADAGRFDVRVAMDARMDEAYTAAWRWEAGRWQAVGDAELVGVDGLARRCEAEPGRWLVGSAAAAFGGRLPGGPYRLAEPAGRPAALWRVAAMAWRDGQALDDAALALPVYLRDRVALTTAERAARAAAAATRT